MVSFLTPNRFLNGPKIAPHRILKTMLPCTRELDFHHIGVPRIDTKSDQETGCRKKLILLMFEAPKGSPGCQKVPRKDETFTFFIIFKVFLTLAPKGVQSGSQVAPGAPK